MENERLQHGRRLVEAPLGGPWPAATLAGLIGAMAEAFGLKQYPGAAWPDSIALALAEVDSDLERLAGTKAELQACQANRDSAQAEARTLAGQIASMGHALAVLEGKAALSLEAAPGERLDAQGRPIRSNANWRRLALAAIAERDEVRASAEEQARTIGALEEELGQVKAELGKARANNESIRADAATHDSLIFAAESDERGAALFGLAELLGRIPLSILAEREAWPMAGELYLKAKALKEEAPADRLARLRSKLEGKESGNA